MAIHGPLARLGPATVAQHAQEASPRAWSSLANGYDRFRAKRLAAISERPTDLGSWTSLSVGLDMLFARKPAERGPQDCRARADRLARRRACPSLLEWFASSGNPRYPVAT